MVVLLTAVAMCSAKPANGGVVRFSAAIDVAVPQAATDMLAVLKINR
jgi:hypothetical protein